jgi:transcriptional regulator with XRE-family HTH domain
VIGGPYQLTSLQNFAAIIRKRRRELDLTQQTVARRIGTSIGYITLLETGRRHPSGKVLSKLAGVLGLDPRELFFCANPETELLVSERKRSGTPSVWDEFSKDQHVRKIHNISDQEMQTLSQVALMGNVRSTRDFLFILNTMRHALGK